MGAVAIIVQIIIAIIIAIVSYMLMPKPETPESAMANLKSFEFPTVDGGRPISEVFGTVKLEGNIIWQGDIAVVPIEQYFEETEEDFTVGFAWFASFAIAYCSRIDAFLEYRMKDTPTYTGNITTSGNTALIRCGENSEMQGSGYSTSKVRVWLGDQVTSDPFMLSETGDNIAYKDVCYLVFYGVPNNSNVDGAFVGDNVTSVPISNVVVKKVALLSTVGGYNFSPYTDINVSGNYADANPAIIILYILTNLIELSVNLIDVESFYDSAVTLYNEGLGMSFSMQSQKQANEWIREILKTIDGELHLHPVTGKFTLKLIRDDYVIGSLTEINDDNARISVERRGWEDCASEISVSFTDRNNNYKKASVYSINPAVRTILGYRKNEKYDYMGLSNQTTAQILLKRMIKKRSYPFMGFRAVVSRDEFPSILPGDVYKVSSTILGISNLVVRIINVSSYKSFEQTLEIEGIEDMFSIGEMDIESIETNQSIAYDWSMGTISPARILDIPAELATKSAVFPLYAKPTGFTLRVKAYVDDALSIKTFKPDAFGYGTLTSGYSWADKGRSENEIDDDSGGFEITPVNNFQEIADTRQQFQQLTHIVIVGNISFGYEFMAVQNLTQLGGGTYQAENIARGLFNSTIRDHNTGEEVWVLYINYSNHGYILTSDKVSFDVDLEPTNHRNVGSQTTIAHTYGFTRETPYPPFNLKGERAGSDITLTWQPAKRNSGARYINPDSIIAGDQEGDSEGSWWVSDDNWVTYTEVTSPTFSQTEPTPKTYKVKSYLNGLNSSEISVYI